LKFQGPHICHDQDEFAELNDKRFQLATGISKTVQVIFGQEPRNECPVISDLAIHKLLDF